MKICLNCEMPITDRCKRNNKKYCCPPCQREFEFKQRLIVIESSGIVPSKRTAKKYLLHKHGHKCSICGISEWMDKPLLMILDHIDGNATNWTVENLRLVCSNCDSQLPTYKNRNKGNGRHWRNVRAIADYYCDEVILPRASDVEVSVVEEWKQNTKLPEDTKLPEISIKREAKPKNFHDCETCGIATTNKRYCSYKCANSANKRFVIEKEELEKLIQLMPYEEIGRKYNVTGAAIKKRCKTLGIVLPYRLGYWTKQQVPL